MKDTIRQLSRRLGVSTDTIRHYREIGMIHPDIQPNGYCLYDEDDLIRILSIREMRSMDISLPEAKDFVCQKSVTEYNDWLALREQSLRHQIYDLELRLSRLKETQVYASCGVRLMNCVEEFDGPATWALSAVGTNKQAMVGDLLQEWVDHFPFTYVSATIPLQSLNDTARPLQIAVGVGSLIRYVEEFRLPCPEGAFFQPGGHFIRTCISTRDILHLSRESLRPLYDYRDAHHLRFAGCSGGRVLFIRETEEGPLYTLLVWIPVRPEQE